MRVVSEPLEPTSRRDADVRRARSRAFVGRATEMELIGAALRGLSGSPKVFYVHGPGGIGKTALLRQIASLARQGAREVVEVDGRFIEGSARRFSELAEAIVSGEQTVLLVDAFEACEQLEGWLLDHFMPRLATDVVVVLASRRAPSLEWTIDPGWRSVVRVLSLPALDRQEGSALLTCHGLEASRHDAVLAFAGGSPLTLALAAAVADLQTGPSKDRWTPSAKVLGTLLSRLVGDVPTREHQRALEAIALAASTDEALLGAALDREVEPSLFAWLRELPFVETTGRGVLPHDAVREALVADLAWRDARSLHEIRQRLAVALLARVREQDDSAAQATMDQLMYVFRHDLTPALSWDHEPLEDDHVDPDDLSRVVQIARDAEGDAVGELVRFWYARQPQGFRLYRAVRSRDVVGFSARLLLTAPMDPSALASDPVVAAAWKHVCEHGPVRDGEKVAMTRFAVHALMPGTPSQITVLTFTRALASLARSPQIRHGFVVYREAERWHDWLGTMMHDIGVRPVIGGTEYAIYGNDWRGKPFERWLAEALGDAGPARAENHGPRPERVGTRGTTARPASEPARAELDDAVREALKLWRRADGLRATRLGTLLAVGDTEVDVDAAVRSAVVQALAGMQSDQATLRGHDALVATYLSPASTQKAAARRLGLTFSTYRRHLRSGLNDLAERLWEQSARC